MVTESTEAVLLLSSLIEATGGYRYNRWYRGLGITGGDGKMNRWMTGVDVAGKNGERILQKARGGSDSTHAHAVNAKL